MKKKIQLSHRSSCVLVLLLLYFNESIMFREMFSATVRGIFTIACVIAACVFFILKKGAQSCRILLNKGSFQLYLALLVCIGLCILFNGINATFDIYGICIMTVSLLVVNIIDQNVFYQAFVDVMVFLAIASVIIFLGYHILPRSLFDIFPNYYWRGGTTLLKNCYLSVLQVSVQNFRNFGIFYEPGYYAVFLLWALVLALFKQDTEIWKIISLFLIIRFNSSFVPIARFFPLSMIAIRVQSCSTSSI